MGWLSCPWVCGLAVDIPGKQLFLAILFFATNYILAELSGCQPDQFDG